MASFERRGKNSWRLVLSLGFGPNGKRMKQYQSLVIEDPALQQSISALDEIDPNILKSANNLNRFIESKEATSTAIRHAKKLNQHFQDEYLKFKYQAETGSLVRVKKIKFADFVEIWREKYGSDPEKLSPATYSNYNIVINSRLIPAFGHFWIDEITPLMILSFLKDLEKPGARLTPKMSGTLTERQKEKLMKPLDVGTIGYIYRVLKNILNRAVEWKLLAENPMNGIPKPGEKDPKRKLLEQRENPQFYDEAEAQRVVDALYKESRKWRLLILGSMIGGARRGELNGLEWPYVHFDEGYISIENNIPLSKDGKAVEKGPKSIASYRNIDMPKWYMDELRAYKDEWNHEKEQLEAEGLWQGGDRQYVFHNGTGKPYYYQHPSKWWKRFCERHGIRYIKFHGLRHSSGTLLLEDEDVSNFDSILKVIQQRLGHSRFSTTSDIYVHVTKKVKRRAAGKYDKFARGNATIPRGDNGDKLGTQIFGNDHFESSENNLPLQ